MHSLGSTVDAASSLDLQAPAKFPHHFLQREQEICVSSAGWEEEEEGGGS